MFENRLFDPGQLLNLLGTAVGQAKEAVLITSARLDPPGPQIVFVNPAFSEMTGYSQEEILDKTADSSRSEVRSRHVAKAARGLGSGKGVFR